MGDEDGNEFVKPAPGASSIVAAAVAAAPSSPDRVYAKLNRAVQIGIEGFNDLPRIMDWVIQRRAVIVDSPSSR